MDFVFLVQMRVYFDTNVMRYFSTAFKEKELPPELREHIVLSPVSALELLSQLCDDSAAQAFAAVQAMWNWLPPSASVLDLPPIFIRVNVAGADEDGERAFKRVTNALTHSLHARSAEVLREASRELRAYLQGAKLAEAQTRAGAVVRMRGELRRAKRTTISEEELRDAFLHSIAFRAGVDPTHAGVTPFVARTEAYYRHETARLRRAIEIPKMNLVSKKRQNDLFDSEQLLYLAAPELCFLTTDRRAYSHLSNLVQGKAIYIELPETLASFDTAHGLLRRIIVGQ